MATWGLKNQNQSNGVGGGRGGDQLIQSSWLNKRSFLLMPSIRWYAPLEACRGPKWGAQMMQLRSTRLMRGLSGDLFDANWPQPVIANFAESLILLYYEPSLADTKFVLSKHQQQVFLHFSSPYSLHWICVWISLDLFYSSESPIQHFVNFRW